MRIYRKEKNIEEIAVVMTSNANFTNLSKKRAAPNK